MRTGAAAGHTGYFHEALYHASDEDFLAVVIPFLLGGVAAGEPTVVALGAQHADLVRAALPAGDADRIVFHPGGDMYARPASAIRAYREMLADHTAAGADQIRIIGELPPEELGATWDWWARYESAINHAYDEFPLWSMCAYDTTTTPAAVLADVARTHPRAAQPGDRHVPSATYVEPEQFLTTSTPVVPDPLQLTPPAFERENPNPADTRAVVARLCGAVTGPPLSRDKVDDLRLAVTEAVTNALHHGIAPVVVRGWAGADRVVLTVTDQGKGPRDPFAGLQAAPHAPAGGLGLWLINQLCDHVAAHHDGEGFTLRLITGNPYHRADRPAGAHDEMAGATCPGSD
jgi:anti-sigma regulatory factor (Ser/Thr protein kinase)